MDDQRRRQSKDFFWLLPLWHVAEGVGADHEEQFRIRQLGANLAQRIYGVAEAAALDFECADAPGLFAFNRQVQHFEPLLACGVGAGVLKGLNGRRREPDFIERGLTLAAPGEFQVAVVDGIEAAAEDAEPHEWSRV